MRCDRRHFMLGSLGAGLGAATLSSCASGPERTQVEDWPTEPSDERQKVSWWSSQIPAADGGDLRTRLIEEFNKTYPQITVELVRGPADTDTNRTSLVTQLAAGATTPDVYLGDVAWPGQFAVNKLATPLSSLSDESLWKSFPEGLRDAATVDDEYYMFPAYIDESFLFYREDLLDKHDLDVPNSWEELVKTSHTLIDSGDVEYGFIYQGNVYEGLTTCLTEWVADAGGSLTDEDVTKALGDSSEVRTAVEFLNKLIEDGITPRAAMTYIEQSSIDAFVAGRAAFLRNWTYTYDTANGAESSQIAGKVGVRARPGFDGGSVSNVSAIGGWGNYINPHTANPGGALAFARWMADEEAQEYIATKGAVIPSRAKSVQTAASVGDRPPYKVAEDITLVARPTATAHYPKMSQAVYVNTNAMALGQSSIDEGTQEMQSGMQLALEGKAL